MSKLVVDAEWLQEQLDYNIYSCSWYKGKIRPLSPAEQNAEDMVRILKILEFDSGEDGDICAFCHGTSREGHTKICSLGKILSDIAQAKP